MYYWLLHFGHLDKQTMVLYSYFKRVFYIEHFYVFFKPGAKTFGMSN